MREVSGKMVKVKVKCTLVHTLRLCTDRTAHRGSRVIALPFYDNGSRRGWGVTVTPWPLFTPGKTLCPLYRRLCGPQDRSGRVRKISLPTGNRSPDRPARSQSLYRLSYPAHGKIVGILKKHILWPIHTSRKSCVLRSNYGKKRQNETGHRLCNRM